MSFWIKWFTINLNQFFKSIKYLRHRHAQTVKRVLQIIKQTILTFYQNFEILKAIKSAVLVHKVRRFCWMGGFCLLVELHREGSAPAACAAVLFFSTNMVFCKIMPKLGYKNVFTLYFLLKVRLEKECSMTIKFILELEVCHISFTLKKKQSTRREFQ